YMKNRTMDHQFPPFFFCNAPNEISCNWDKSIHGNMQRIWGHPTVPFCFNQKPAAEFMFDYTRQFFNNYKNMPKLATVSLFEPHTTAIIVPRLNDILVKFLESIRQENNTVIFILADHGVHFGKYVTISDGKIEHKNPP